MANVANMAVVDAALARLIGVGDSLWNGFPETTWRKVKGTAEKNEFKMNGGGGLDGLTITRNGVTVLESDLEIPTHAHGLSLEGEPLEGLLFSLYPTDITHDGKSVFKETGSPVAFGPALFTILPKLKPGKNGKTVLEIRAGDQQIMTWFSFKLTTPAFRAAFEMVDLAWAQLAYAKALATTEDEVAIVLRAAQMVPEVILPISHGLAGALHKMAAELSCFAERAKKVKVHLIGHSHIDMNWLWTWSDTVEVIKRDMKSVVGLMADYPELTFSHSQPGTYEVIRQQEPELFKKILAYIAAGRWEPTTMQWIEGDTNMASGEAHVRQLLEGVHYTRDILKFQPFIFHAPDTFGHAGNLPQLAASAGTLGYYHHRTNPGRENQWPAFWWEGQDGSRVLGISTPSYNGEIRPRDVVVAAIKAVEFGFPCAMHFHGIGDHGGGPARQNMEVLRRLQKIPGLPTMVCSSEGAYVKEIIAANLTLPTSKGETITIFEGCYTTHADTKRYNRFGENLLTTADTLAALAGVDPAPLLEPWRMVLFNQFHDILDGSAIHEAYEKNKEDFAAVEKAARNVTEKALDILQGPATPLSGAHDSGGRIALTNPLGHRQKEVVTVPGLKGNGAVRLVCGGGKGTVGQFTDDGLLLVADVEGFSTKSFSVTDEAAEPTEDFSIAPAFAPTDGRKAKPTFEESPDAVYAKIETPHFRVYVRKDCGIICGLFDKRVSKELVANGMRKPADYVDSARPDLGLGVLQLIDELPHGMTAWQIHEIHQETSLLRAATFKLVENGPVRIVCQFVHKVPTHRQHLLSSHEIAKKEDFPSTMGAVTGEAKQSESTITQRLIFYRDLPRIDFETRMDWQEVGNSNIGVPGLKVAFTARMDDCEAWFETPFAAVKRPADGQEVPALRWADVGGPNYGIAVMNDSKYGYDALGCRLRLTLVRSGYDPDAISDQGSHEVRYSLVPHVGDWRAAGGGGIVGQAAAFNQPVLGRLAGKKDAEIKPKLIPEWQGPAGVRIACMKRARNGNGTVIRLYEAHGSAAEGRLRLKPNAKVWETNILEDRLRRLEISGSGVAIAMRPWQVRTLLVED